MLGDVWTDDDDRPLGEWVEVSRDEWRQVVGDAGGLKALSVFSSLTDPDGEYGEPRIYTAWGFRELDFPLVDICDYGGTRPPERQVFRKFVARAPVAVSDGRVG